MSKHSQIIGGSTADRVIGCPGSVQAIAALPAVVDQPSSYAMEGTALHEIMAALVEGTREIDDVKPGEKIVVDDVVPITITQEHIDTCIKPAWEFFVKLIEAFGGFENCEIVVEQRVQFPGVEGAFGTLDVIVYAKRFNTTILVDWKFGAGVAVKAVYPGAEPDSEYVNRQLMFYGCAARNTCPDLFGDTIMAYVVQPRVYSDDEKISSAEILHEELDDFEALVAKQLEIAGEPNPPRHMGPWCRWAACRPYCPLHQTPVLELAALEPGELKLARKTLPAVTLMRMLAIVDQAEEVIAEVRKQAHEWLEAGHELPGWCLKPKRGTRQWTVAEKNVVAALRGHGLNKAQCYTEPTLKSPAQIEKILPAKVKLAPGLVQMVSTGTTLARGDENLALSHADALKLLASNIEID